MMVARESKPDDGRAGFPRTARLRSRSDFERVHRLGRRHHSGPLLCIMSQRGSDAREASARLGLAVSRRVGHAPRRNLIKRRLREAFRAQRQMLPKGVDLVISVRPHDPLPVAAYAALIERAVRTLNR